VEIGRTFRDIAEEEIRLQKSFGDDCAPQLRVVENAMVVLSDVMATVEPLDPPYGPGEIGLPPTGAMLFTLMTMGVRALRVVQAARPTLAAGYEFEALVYNRIIVELTIHRRAMLKDETGEEARQWLTSPRGRGIGKRIREVARGDLYKRESYAAHGDPRLLAPLFDLERSTFPLAPARSDLTRASLVLHSSFLVDHIEIIVQLAGLPPHPVFEPLRRAQKIEWQKFYSD
jgi:hypothetical protein